mgnify:CR=1 FL=1
MIGHILFFCLLAGTFEADIDNANCHIITVASCFQTFFQYFGSCFFGRNIFCPVGVFVDDLSCGGLAYGKVIHDIPQPIGTNDKALRSLFSCFQTNVQWKFDHFGSTNDTLATAGCNDGDGRKKGKNELPFVTFSLMHHSFIVTRIKTTKEFARHGTYHLQWFLTLPDPLEKSEHPCVRNSDAW